MSGGDWNYVYRTFEDVAERLAMEKCPYRRALGLAISAAAQAIHDVEWVDSDDMSPGDEIETIKKAISPKFMLQVLVDQDASSAASVLETDMSEEIDKKIQSGELIRNGLWVSTPES